MNTNWKFELLGRLMRFLRPLVRASLMAVALCLLYLCKGVPAQASTLNYLPGSTVKVQQLLGEFDKQQRRPTLSQTFTRYKIRGTDEGNSFEYQGRVYFLFGDTVGALDHALDTIATTEAADPEAGVRLDFLTVPGQPYLTIRPPGISMGAFETPTGGIALGDRMYVAVRTDHSRDWSTDRLVLTRFTLPSTFVPLRTISQAPSGHFLMVTMQADPLPGGTAGLPPGGPWVFIWGTGKYRGSDVYLSIVPAADFENGGHTLYFSGMDAAGKPVWNTKEDKAEAIIRNGTLADVSVVWNKELGMWLATFDSRPPAQRGVLFSYSTAPWGPWSTPQLIFQPRRDGGYGKFIHDPKAVPNDGLAGPVIGVPESKAEEVIGGEYAPYMIQRWMKVQGNRLTIYYTMSVWNPYVVELMKSEFQIGD
jgi:hypothetical protein